MGHQPIVIDNLSTSHKWAVKGGPFIVGDVIHENFVKSTLQKHNIDTVIHFAANAYVGESNENPRNYNNINVMEYLKN